MTFIPEIASEISEYLPLADLMNWRLTIRNDGDYILKIISREPIDIVTCKLLAPNEKLIKKYLSHILIISVGDKIEHWQIKKMYDYIISHVDLGKLIRTHDPDYKWFARLSAFVKDNDIFDGKEYGIMYRYVGKVCKDEDTDEYKLFMNAYCNGYYPRIFKIDDNLNMVDYWATPMY